MAMNRLPKTLQATLSQGASTSLRSSSCTPTSCPRYYASLAWSSASTKTAKTAKPTAATTTAMSMTRALGRCRTVIRNKHHAGAGAASTQAGAGSKRYSHLAAAATDTAPPSPPPAISSTLHQHQKHPMPPQSSPLFKMNNPASIVPQSPQTRRRYSPQHFYQNRILDPYVNQAVNPITLRQLVFFGRNMQEDKLLKSANYVRTELPVRLAHRIRDFQNLPFIVGTNPHIELVYDLYWQAFEKLSKVPEIKTLEENDAFCDMIKALLNDHLVVIPQLALGIMECSKHIPTAQVDQFMNKMLRSRISRRVLAEQHISLTSNFNSPNHMMTDQGYIGIIYTHCRPRDIVERTALLAAETCRLGSAGQTPPKVMLDGNIDAEFSYIPDHIEYILYELLKNSMRFVMQNGVRDSKTGELPPIQITVCEGTHDIVFRISDKGGGIHPEIESHLWSYSQSPARFANFEKISKMAATVQEQMVSPSRSAPMAGSSYGSNYSVNKDNSEGIVLPPPPATNKNPIYHPNESTLLPDRHAPSKNSISNNSGSSSFSTSSSQHQTIIDPNQYHDQSMLRKPGHLDRAFCQETKRQQKDQSMHLGIGLPMSKVYAEYWGGDLKVITMHGYGTDAYARFCKFGNIYENLDV
ncbi:hypothetical protein BG011_008264 [Mortierella polycephala]|uniref:Protein-serine/threonine kinase n=1 Tax=Mortierella polycephala TaxID=41804 RepID=A0A9P6PQT1_9FUNG|nr:hypothetical protein BG011_008264 [Mortierella polycephala]